MIHPASGKAKRAPRPTFIRADRVRTTDGRPGVVEAIYKTPGSARFTADVRLDAGEMLLDVRHQDLAREAGTASP